jgi:DNA polymerase-4
VQETLELRLRIGVAATKFLARVAAEESGETRFRQVASGDESVFLNPMPIHRLPGVGPKTQIRLEQELDIRTVGELLEASPSALDAALGKNGLRVLEYARGRDDSPVRATPHPQSFSCETSLADERDDADGLREDLRALARELEEKLESQGLRAGRVALKIHFVDSGSESRSQTLTRRVVSSDSIYRIALRLLDRTQLALRPARRLGLSVSKLDLESARDRQLELFPETD